MMSPVYHAVTAVSATDIGAGGAQFQRLQVPQNGGVPNNPDLPALVATGALPADMGAQAICALYQTNGWRGVWTWTVFDFHHYHPNAHEVLTCASGWADIRLGGPAGPVVRVAPGDVLLLPAGMGHCREASGAGFQVCGGYPSGQTDSITTAAGEIPIAAALDQIAAVPHPSTDPIFGRTGPLLRAWLPEGETNHGAYSN